MKILFLLFFIVPLVEIYFLIQVGEVIGAGFTIALVVATAVLGAALVRSQGFSTINRVQSQLNQGALPAVEIFEGVFLLVAGALLLTPGFFTDAIGFACLTPPLRRAVIRYMLSSGMVRGNIHVQGAHVQGASAREPGQPGRVIDAEYRDVGQD